MAFTGLLVPAAALAQATQPSTRPAARSPNEIVAEMSAAQQQLKGAIGNARDLADPTKRAAVAPGAIPPLRLLIADQRELAAATGHATSSPNLFEIQMRAILAALGDRESVDGLAAMAADPRPAVSLRGQGGQLLARWVQNPGNAAIQGKIVDDLAALDAAHPDSNDLALFTGLMTGSSATPAVRARLRGLLDPMTSQAAGGLRARLPEATPTTGPVAQP